MATRVMTCLLVLALAGGVGVTPRAARAEGDPEAAQALRTLERQAIASIAEHLTYLQLPHKVSGSMDTEGVVRIALEVTTNDLRSQEDANELAQAVAVKLKDFMSARWPRLRIAPGSRLFTKRPFSFTEKLPDLSASIAILPAPRRKLTVNPRPAPRHAPRAPPVAGGLVVGGPSLGEVTLHNRVQRVFQARWIVKAMRLIIPAAGRARVEMRITAVSQGLARDRQRLRRATVELGEVLKLSGAYAVAEGSTIRFDLHHAKSGASTGGMVAVFREGHWRVDGEEPPNESAPATPGPARRFVGQPNAGGLPPVEARPPVAASLPERNRRARTHPLPLPPPDEEQSGAHRPLSQEDLIAVPGSMIGHVNSARARVRASYRHFDPGTYSAVGDVKNFALGGAISVVTARRMQATVAYSHPRQQTQLGTGAELDQSGDAVVFSLKYRTPPALRRHAHLALGFDAQMQSRTDEAFRVPDDYAQADSVWATYNLWSSPISLVHLMIKRVGVFGQTREWTQVAIAQELLAHHPFRRAYWELVVDDRVDKPFDVVGVALTEPVSFNVGAEMAVGRRASLQIHVPRLFSEHYRQAQLVLSVGI